MAKTKTKATWLLAQLRGMGRVTLLAVLVLTWMPTIVLAGGPDRMRHQPTAAEKRATATLRAWEERGMTAAPEMIEAVCVRAPLLEDGVKEQLIGLGQAALPTLIRAAEREGCDLARVFAGIVCETGQGEAELRSMFLSKRPRVVSTAVLAFSVVAKPEYESPCALGKPIVKRLIPALSPLLHSQTGDVLHGA